MINDPNYIRYTFYEVNIKYPNEYGIEKHDLGMFLQLLRTKLKNNNYHIYTEGQRFEYKNANITVQSNEVLVAVKEQKEDVVKWNYLTITKWNY